MDLERDPSKRIIDIGIATEDGATLVVLMLCGSGAIIIETGGLNQEQAELLADGYEDGLLGSEWVGKELNELSPDDLIDAAPSEFPFDVADLAIFKNGALGGLALATQGYWIDAKDFIPRTTH